MKNCTLLRFTGFPLRPLLLIIRDLPILRLKRENEKENLIGLPSQLLGVARQSEVHHSPPKAENTGQTLRCRKKISQSGMSERAHRVVN